MHVEFGMQRQWKYNKWDNEKYFHKVQIIFFLCHDTALNVSFFCKVNKAKLFAVWNNKDHKGKRWNNLSSTAILYKRFQTSSLWGRKSRRITNLFSEHMIAQLCHLKVSLRPQESIILPSESFVNLKPGKQHICLIHKMQSI